MDIRSTIENVVSEYKAINEQLAEQIQQLQAAQAAANVAHGLGIKQPADVAKYQIPAETAKLIPDVLATGEALAVERLCEKLTLLSRHLTFVCGRVDEAVGALSRSAAAGPT